MAKNGFKILDSDMHIMEPADLWERYIEKKYRSRAPRGITSSNVRDLRMAHPDGREWGNQTTDAIAPTAATTLSVIKALINHMPNAAGLPNRSSKPWISKESISPYSIRHAG